jgi:hypothetical protein
VEVQLDEKAELAEAKKIKESVKKPWYSAGAWSLSRLCSANSDAVQSIPARRSKGVRVSEELTKLYCLCILLLRRWKFLLSGSTMSLSTKA